MTTATATATTWQAWLRSQIADGRTRGDDLADDAPDDAPAGLFAGDVRAARRALAGSGLGVASDSHGLEFFRLDRLAMAQDAFDLLRGAGGAMDAEQLLRELRARGHAATHESVFALPSVDCAIIGEIPTEAYRLLPGARRPIN